MFQPPRELMYKGDWEAAQAHANEHSKWIVNPPSTQI